MMNPASWNAKDVERWARGVGISDSAILALCDNEIDGPTLATLEKDELKSESVLFHCQPGDISGA